MPFSAKVKRDLPLINEIPRRYGHFYQFRAPHKQFAHQIYANLRDCVGVKVAISQQQSPTLSFGITHKQRALIFVSCPIVAITGDIENLR